MTGVQTCALPIYYKFTLGHRGSEIYPFKLNTDQYNTFQEKRVEFDEMTHDEICEVLGVESYFDSPLDSLMGPYPETFYMKVEDEDGNLVYETEELDRKNCDYEEKYCSQEAYLIIEDYCKGDLLVYDIPLEEDEEGYPGVRKYKSHYTGRDSRVYIDFPYTPKREYVEKVSEAE